MTAGIYRFINNRTGEVYVGQSFNVYARRGKHHKELTLGTHHNRGLQEDHNRGDTFTFEVLEKMPNATRADLEKREIYYIEKFNSFYEGYNQTPGGEYDKYKGRYEYGGDRLPFHKYKPVTKLNACPECGGKLVKRQGEYGKFAGCSNYPDCTFSCSLNKVNFESKNKSTSYNLNTSKSYVNQKTIFLKTCRYCNKQYNVGLTVCPYCNNDPNSNSIITNEQEFIKEDFEKFCNRKKYYLTKADCDFLSDKYGIDISNVTTVKKANPLIKKYLNKNNQWENAMEELYKHNNPSIQTYNKYAVDIHTQKSYNIPSSNSDDSKQNVESDSKHSQNKSTTKIVNYYSYWNNKVYIEKESPNDKSTINKPEPTKNIKSSNSPHTYESVRYCTNCGHKISLNDDYCSNCGEKTDNNNIEQKNKSSKDSGNDDWAAVVLAIIIILFIISLGIIYSDIEGPISSIASVIFIGILCFGCYASNK